MKKITLQLILDGSSFMQVVRRFVEDHGSEELRLVGLAENYQESLKLAADLQPDAVLIDLDTPGVSALTLVPLFRRTLPHAAIVALTFDEPDWYRDAAFKAGIAEAVNKQELSTNLVPTIRRLVEEGRQVARWT